MYNCTTHYCAADDSAERQKRKEADVERLLLDFYRLFLFLLSHQACHKLPCFPIQSLFCDRNGSLCFSLSLVACAPDLCGWWSLKGMPIVFLLLSDNTILAHTRPIVPQDVLEDVDEDVEASTLALTVQASFPASEIFGIKLVNGLPTQALLSFNNEEPSPVTVAFIGGSLWTTDEESRVVRNLTVTKYSVEISAGQKETIPYSFTTEMQPQDLRLKLVSIVSDKEGRYFTLDAFDGTVSVVEPETSIFDPQM
jgi:translocon-associated protein (TRAP) alpha subunit